MAASQFKAVSWAPLDPITDEKLNNMVNNDNFLLETQMRGRYNNNINRDRGLLIVSGTVLFTARKAASANANVQFPSGTFNTNCTPIVTTGVYNQKQKRVWCTVSGPGGKAMPQSTGFQVHVVTNAGAKAKKKISSNFRVGWMAMGF